jgi:hypothetical protein
MANTSACQIQEQRSVPLDIIFLIIQMQSNCPAQSDIRVRPLRDSIKMPLR